MSRYITNSLKIIVIGGMAGQPAFWIQCRRLDARNMIFGRHFINSLIVLSLMFAPAVVRIPNYLTIAWLGWIDTYWAVIVACLGQHLRVCTC